MEPYEALLETSELALGLLGFGGVVVAFSGAPEEQGEALYAGRLAGLLGSSANALIFSILPLYFHAASDPVPWGTLSLVQGLVLVLFAAVHALLWYRSGAGSWVIGLLGMSGTLALAGFQFANWLGEGSFQAYLAAVLWQLFIPTVLFARMAQVLLTRRR